MKTPLNSKIESYVVGFMFNFTLTSVGLIRKEKPLWQKGKLNGIGGKIEPGEDGPQGMVREFREETGYETTKEEWAHFLTMGGVNDDGSGFNIEFFVSVGDLAKLRSVESEEVEVVALEEVTPVRTDMIENLPWLIPLALDHIADGRPAFVRVHYSKAAVDAL